MVYCPIAEYRPDVAVLNSHYSTKIKNVVPLNHGYGPFPELDFYSEAQLNNQNDKDNIILSAFAIQDLEGQTYNFIGTKTDIFLLKGTNTNWKNISKKVGMYHASKNSTWSFASFGNYVIAVNKNDAPQIFQLKSSEKFVDLKGNPPRAAIVKVWGDFLCLMQLNGYPHRVHWSGLNDIECWTIGEKYCDYQDFIEGGHIQGSSQDKNPLIILEKAIYKGTFLPGSDLVFNFQKLHSGHGARLPETLATLGNYTFFADSNGFFQLMSDGSLLPIGLDKVNRTFSKWLTEKFMPIVQCIIDPFYTRVYWAFRNAETYRFEKMLVYDWICDKWSFIEIDVEMIFSSFLPILSLKDWSKNYPSLDSIPYSFDDPCIGHSVPTLSAIKKGRLAHYLSDKYAKAELYSEQIGSYSAAPLRIKSIQPNVDAEGVISVLRTGNCQPEYEQLETILSQKFYQAGPMLLSMRAPIFCIKFEIIQKERQNWSAMVGFDLEMAPSGKR